MINGGFPRPNNPAWTYQDKPIMPFIAGLTSSDMLLTEADDLYNAMQQGLIPRHADTKEDPCVVTELFLARLRAYRERIEDAEIHVENLKCPVLLFSGKLNSIWPSSLYCDLIMQRLDKNASFIKRKHINYKNAGHGFVLPFQPELNMPILHQIGKFWCKLGGTEEGNICAHENAWAKTIEFLSELLFGPELAKL
jgi:hypothetical protein